MIAEPWDIGPGGYQLGNFPAPFLEWNDRARDTIRRFWRGDSHMTGALATTLAGSSDIFARHGQHATRTVNFVAAHDGFTLMDLVSYSHKHNERNGEDNRDGHNENLSWNNGAEGETTDKVINRQRIADVAALLSTLFATRGAIMLTAGDEGGRSQQGNNNAYCQDNDITWLDWSRMNPDLVDLTASLAEMRKRFSVFSQTSFFTGNDGDVEWISGSGDPMTVPEWEAPEGGLFGMIVKTTDTATGRAARLAILFNRDRQPQDFTLPLRAGGKWRRLSSDRAIKSLSLKPRSVAFLVGC